MAEEHPLPIKCVLVGDAAVGKTALLVRFTSEAFPDVYKPTVYESTGVEVCMDGIPICLGLWDTGGYDGSRSTRPISYRNADVVLLCYSVANPASLVSVRRRWLPEVRQHLPEVPLVLVATQTDQREMGPGRHGCVTKAAGQRLAHLIHAKTYLECSALNNCGVDKVFECAVRSALYQTRGRGPRRFWAINQCHIF